MRKTLVQTLLAAFCAIPFAAPLEGLPFAALAEKGGGVMLLGARNFFMGGGKPTARSYIQDGLVAMWDGLENDGWGVFNPNKGNNWYDLVGHRRISGWGWNSTCGWFDGTFYVLARVDGNSANAVAVNLTNGMTVECCSPNQYLVNKDIVCGVFCQWGVGNAAQYGVSYNATAYKFRKDGTVSRTLTTYLSNNTKTTQTLFIHPDGTMSGLIAAKLSLAWDVTSSFSLSTINPVFTTPSASTTVAGPTFYNARYYNRILTQDEVVHNYAIDKARFNLP